MKNSLILMIAFVALAMTACKERETQVEYWDNAKSKPRYVFEIDKETGKKDGFYKEYWKNGNMFLEGAYKDGLKHGTFKRYLSNGQLWFENNYKTGLRDGTIKVYNLEAKLISKGEFDRDTYVHKDFFTDSRDGKKYPIVKIGSQVWMAASLDYTTPNSGCYASGYCEMYGRVYSWKEALTVCPDGWHLPSVDEFKKLVGFVGGETVGGLMLKATTTWYVNEERERNGEDAFGFSAYDAMGYEIAFWSSTDYEYNNSYRDWAYYMHLGTGQDASINAWEKKRSLKYVRCVKGKSVASSDETDESEEDESGEYIPAQNSPAKGVAQNSSNGKIVSDQMLKKLSSVELTSSDLNQYNSSELRILRNAIFAKHGYIFKSDDLKNYFAQFSWYSPRFADVNSKLSAIEKKNVATIKAME